MKVILVPIADRPECAVALDAAFKLSKDHDACVMGTHIRPHRESRVTMTLPSFSGTNEADWLESTRDADTKRQSTDAEAFFKRLANRNGVPVAARPRKKPAATAIWAERVGSPSRVMPIVGPVADMLLVSRPARKRGGKVARVFLLEALLNSSSPVLVLPQKKQKSVGKRVVIAWNQSPEAMRSIAGAMPLLLQAESVTIVTAGPEVSLGPKSRQLVNYLKCWGIDADIQPTQGKDVAREVMTVYSEARADLLVMGAYSRSRLRELVFGGMTQFMLYESAIPVLMHHA